MYFGTFGAFLSFRYRFGHMPRLFTSPTGLFGGIFGIVLFAFVFFVVSIVNIEDQAIYYFLGYMAACLVYYILVAEKRQFFSPEEQKRFLKAYILNAKTKKAANYTILESIYLAFNCLVMKETSTSHHSKQSKMSNAPSKNGKSSMATSIASSTAPKHPDDGTDGEGHGHVQLVAHQQIAAKSNSVAPAESVGASLRAASIVTASTRASHKVGVAPAPVVSAEHNPAVTPARRVTWSGKLLDNAESVKFLTMMTSTKNKEDVLSAFPDLLIASTTQREVDGELV